MSGAIFNPATDYDPGFSIDPQFATALDTVAPTIVEKMTDQAMQGESWVDTLQRMLPALTATYQQKKILDLQMERARQGLPPLNATEFGVGVNVGLSADTQRLLLIGGVALLAAIFLLKRRG